ncbi:MAG: hypothetical protein DWQ34_27190 [Planctomycetota bacterium]|nr:MAG: hypothetical protein DWQ29_17945 [Planctomycetota bacterium]REJ86465.1 MAG: hypothetical protein DWQ34_27190 [Planctomycetota bacterium]REK28055.1 MAG: hypothetical protein DWQ41_06485 [Planctomycetota bacterium]REK37582.1 MAG: hypothetical protein DWQ45_06170 [Planctomycetota bacterium]
MVESYAGIVTRNGVEFFVVETKHCMPFLLKRAYARSTNEAICFWALIPPPAGRYIAEQVRCGRFHQGFDLLNRHAVDFGTILPLSASKISDIHLIEIIDVPGGRRRQTAVFVLASFG